MLGLLLVAGCGGEVHGDAMQSAELRSMLVLALLLASERLQSYVTYPRDAIKVPKHLCVSVPGV